MEGPSKEEVQKQPWKYVGYRRYSEFVSSDSDLLIFRRFGTLNARFGLLLQDRISFLEHELDELDKQYSKRGTDPINNGTIRDDMEDREALLKDIAYHLDKYSRYPTDPISVKLVNIPIDNFLIQQSQLSEYVRAPSRDVKTTIKTWLSIRKSTSISTTIKIWSAYDHARKPLCELDRQLTYTEDCTHLEETEPGDTIIRSEQYLLLL